MLMKEREEDKPSPCNGHLLKEQEMFSNQGRHLRWINKGEERHNGRRM